MTTFRSFCSPAELLALLIERFVIPTPHIFMALDPQHLLSSVMANSPCNESASLSNGSLQQSQLHSFVHNLSQSQLEQAFHKFRQEYQKPIQLKVLSIINHWVSNHFYDFESDSLLLVRLIDFLSGNDRSIKLITSHKKWCTKIQEVIKRKHRHQQQQQQQQNQLDSAGHSADGEVADSSNRFNNSTSTAMSSSSAPPASDSGTAGGTAAANASATAFSVQCPEPVWHYAKEGEVDAYDLLTLHPLEIGRQVTLLQFFLYRAIKPFELVDAAWTKRDKYQRSPQLLKLIDHSNNLTYWVARSIVETESVEERVEMFSRVLEIMTVFEELNNFNGIVAFFAALNCQPVYRLDESKSRLDKEKKGWYDHYVQLCGNGHLTELLQKLRSINPPCVPFAGTYLTQIVLRLESLKQMEGRMNQQTTKVAELAMANSEQQQTCEQNADSASVAASAVSTERSPLPTPKGKADAEGAARKMISFMKCRKIAAIIREIQMYQNQPYSLRVEPTIRHFLESLNPLNGFKDKDDLENYLYNQSHKIEPKNGEIPNAKPKHPPEALKSPGVKQQKTPISGSSGGTFHRFPTAKSSAKSSASSPHSPCNAPSGGGGALLSPSHINVPTRSPASAGSASGSSMSMALAEDPNFAIVDISPGQFPRWLGDTCGRINAAFISEYAPTAAAAATFHQHRQMSSGGSPTSPSAALLQQQRRRPPAPLSAGESHFTFPPAAQQHQSQQQRLHHLEPFRKPPAPAPHHQISAMLSLPLEEHQQRVAPPPPPTLPQLGPSLSAALPAFPLAKPPLARKKLPAVDPPECSSPSSTGRTMDDHVEIGITTPETPPQIPPRSHPPLGRQQQMPYQQSPLSNFMMGAGGCCNSLPEAVAPPRPPKKGICRSPTTDQQTMPQLRQRQSSHQSLSPSVVESPPPQPIAEAIAPPIPPKPSKSATPK
ncbi:hypothetical protein niasHT_007617 [Heterodera trifolii]|uniref:Ras-GEF domain-containing protein n=1 Tax=Heterodera trifolii TaxID=157864 RepID=A0ABD2LQ07_9BILA